MKKCHICKKDTRLYDLAQCCHCPKICCPRCRRRGNLDPRKRIRWNGIPIQMPNTFNAGLENLNLPQTIPRQLLPPGWTELPRDDEGKIHYRHKDAPGRLTLKRPNQGYTDKVLCVHCPFVCFLCPKPGDGREFRKPLLRWYNDTKAEKLGHLQHTDNETCLDALENRLQVRAKLGNEIFANRGYVCRGCYEALVAKINLTVPEFGKFVHDMFLRKHRQIAGANLRRRRLASKTPSDRFAHERERCMRS